MTIYPIRHLQKKISIRSGIRWKFAVYAHHQKAFEAPPAIHSGRSLVQAGLFCMELEQEDGCTQE